VACMSRVSLQERMESIMTHETRRRSPIWLTRMLVTLVVAATGIGFATFSPAPLLTAGEPAASGYDFDVRVTRQDDGRHTLTVRIDTPDGPITSVAVVKSVPDARTVSATHGGLTYKVDIALAADGSAVGELNVSDGVRTIASATRGFDAPLKTLAPKRISEGMTPPKVISRVEPHYSEEAKKNNIFGVVILEATINEAGVVTDVRVLKPLPYGLDQAAVEAIRQWRFEPATIEGRPVPVIFNFTFNFKTDGGESVGGAVPPPPPRP
jgi:TonB family protein